MPEYECDQCGACCQGYLIVEADELDLLREPRLIEADPHYAGQPAKLVLQQLQEDVGRALILACGTARPCRFLGADKKCDVYPTRPNVCVAMQAGDEQCQESRHEAGLPPLEPLTVDPSGLHPAVVPEPGRSSSQTENSGN
jgi:Fe-S-cluster containining protein